MTVREHLENAVATLAGDPVLHAHAIAELRGPVMPTIATHAWAVFGRLNAKRTMGASAPNPITDEAMLAHCRLLDDTLTPLDVRLIDTADAALLRAFHARTAA